MYLFLESYCSKSILYQDSVGSPHLYEKTGTTELPPFATGSMGNSKDN